MKRAADVTEGAEYLIIVHVLNDVTFKTFLENASLADMPLFRGMFLRATLSRPVAPAPSSKDPNKRAKVGPPVVRSLGFQQAFLPKFENEGQDTSIADAIVSSAGSRYMVVSVKHSGSLATLSHNLMGSKNAINNDFTNTAIILLKAHYSRLPGETCVPLLPLFCCARTANLTTPARYHCSCGPWSIACQRRRSARKFQRQGGL